MKSSIKDLKTRGFYSLEYPGDLRAAVDQAAEAWRLFCALPAEIKSGLPYSNGGTGVGYERKNGTGVSKDRKENFDLTTEGVEWVTANISKINNPAALDFVKKAAVLVDLICPTAFKFAREVEDEFGVTGFEAEVRDSKPRFFTRFIHYPEGSPEGTETAEAHVDQSGATLHLFESEAGLQCLTYDGRWIDMPVSIGETVIIPAMQLQYLSEGELRALCHRVISTKATSKRPRFSAVCFIQFKNKPKYDKDRCGRLQERKPGFNYDMPIGEFKKMFKRDFATCFKEMLKAIWFGVKKTV
jgi:isopenicillin N synthase-like dioxygenase